MKKVITILILVCLTFSYGNVLLATEVTNETIKDGIENETTEVDNNQTNTEIVEEELEPVIALNKTSATIVVGKSVILKLENAKSTVKWSSSNKKVATVDSNGKVKGIKKGTVTITAKSDGISYKCKVRVEKPVISHTSRTILKGYNYKMKFTDTTLTPTWKSSDTSVVTIDSSGKMTAIRKGVATIRGYVGGKTYSCKINVEAPFLNKTSKTILKGKTYKLKLSGSSRKVTWKSYNKKIATVSSSGTVTAKKVGTVKIAAITGGKEYICNVQVVNKGLNKSSVIMVKGNTYTLKTYGLTGTKKWSSSNKSVATVNSSGLVSGKARGSTIISVKANGKIYKCKVRVEAPYLTVSKTTIIVGSNSTLRLRQTSKKVTWKTNNKNIAIVDSKGRVTGTGVGTATVSGTVDGRAFSYKIKVKEPSEYSGWIEKNGKELYYASGLPVTSWQTIDGRKYCFNDNGELVSKFGIDVSKYQGTIDWGKVAADGVDFAFIRLGYRGYRNGKLVVDPKYEANITGANANKIDTGVYFFTQATNAEEGIEEALYVLKNIKGYNVNYPIVIDTEASGAEEDDGRADNISKLNRTLAVKAFCETIKEAGYTPMIYASKSWFKNKLDMSMLENYEIWVAHYTTGNKVTDYSGAYGVWQYTSSGKVDGISGRCDLNVCVKDY